jgi:hypothetical protein
LPPAAHWYNCTREFVQDLLAPSPGLTRGAGAVLRTDWAVCVLR